MDGKQAQEIGRRIALARKEAGDMTQTQLADLLNISMRSVQDYERGLRVPWKHFERLEQIFGRPLRWFLRGEEESPLPAVPPRHAADAAAHRHDELLRELRELREEQRVLMARLDSLAPRRR